MYITSKKTKSKKHDNILYYFYVCESNRVDGIVKNKQTYLCCCQELSIPMIYEFESKSTDILSVGMKQRWSVEKIEEIEKLIKLKAIDIYFEIMEQQTNQKYSEEYKNAYKDRIAGNGKNYYYNFQSENNNNISNSKNCNYISKEICKKFYRTLALTYHPDKGGTNEEMIALNQLKLQWEI